MTRLCVSFLCVAPWMASPLLADEPRDSLQDTAASEGLVATIDGRPGPALQELIEPKEDDLSDICCRKTDVIYGRKYGMALLMDVYTPNDQRNGASVIQVISGGLWSGAEYRRMPVFSRNIRLLVENGYVVFAVMHGSQPMFTLHDIRTDLPRAVRYIRHNAGHLGVQSDRIGITGLSSGGHLALLAAVSGSAGDPRSADPVERQSSELQAAVVYFPNTDCLNYGEKGRLKSEHFHNQNLKVAACYDFRRWDNETGRFLAMSDEERRAVFREASPVVHVTSDDPPTLLFHGDRDQTVPIQQSQVFVGQMEKVRVDCKLVIGEGKGHGWEPRLSNEETEFIGWFDRYLLH